jgi:hypothetical protein
MLDKSSRYNHKFAIKRKLSFHAKFLTASTERNEVCKFLLNSLLWQRWKRKLSLTIQYNETYSRRISSARDS